MEKNIKRVVLGVIYCTAFFLPIVLSSPAHSQSFEWVKLLGTTSIDEGTGVAVDTSGNIYVTGLTYGNLGGETKVGDYYDAFLAKYDSSGTMKWVKLLGTKKWVDGTGVAVDTSGNIYVTGYTEGDLGGETNTGYLDAFLVKYDSSGTIKWVKLLGTKYDDEGYGVTVDTSGNIYVTGVTEGDLGGETNAGDDDAFLAKYDSSGTMKWVKLGVIPSDDSAIAYGVAVDTSGNIYVTGAIGEAGYTQYNMGNYDAFLAKYDSSGTMKWVKLLGSASNGVEGNGVTVDTSGNIYVTGYTFDNLGGETNVSGSSDAFLAKYDSSGTMKWVKLLGPASGGSGNGVTVDTSGNIYVTGYTDGDLGGETNTNGSSDAFLAKYDSSGTMKCVKLLESATNGDEGDGVTVDTSGNIYITGFTFGDIGGETYAGNIDAFLAKYKGSFPWEIFYPAFIKKK